MSTTPDPSTEISVKPRESDIPPIDVQELTASKFPADQWKADQPAWHRKPSPAYPVESGMAPHTVGQPYVPDRPMPLIGNTAYAGRVVAAGIVSIPAGRSRKVGTVEGNAPSAMSLYVQSAAATPNVLQIVASESSTSGWGIGGVTSGLIGNAYPVAGCWIYNSTGAPIDCQFLIIAHDRIGI